LTKFRVFAELQNKIEKVVEEILFLRRNCIQNAENLQNQNLKTRKDQFLSIHFERR